MATVSLPYKLQVFVPEALRQDLKSLAHAHNTSLQNLVTTLLTLGVQGKPITNFPQAIAQTLAADHLDAAMPGAVAPRSSRRDVHDAHGIRRELLESGGRP